uniref:Spire n=1 Tax=Timema shepardi TaxID=629360 RepID=A0A7R9B1N1_TIMSH|nr:unnamed protein product [Timema shepardi]
MAYDLATQCPTRRASMRRHTVVAASAIEMGTQSLPHSRPQSRGPTPSSASSETDSGNLGCTLPEMSWSRTSLQDELLHSKNWQQAMECLSLTLEEIVHIRSVLTKAELESLPVEGHVKEDVEKKKVCFLCLKTRFGLFGPKGQECKLCKRTVCTKCSSKMRIPTEHFSRVPVFALSPGLSSPEEESKESFPRSLMNRLMVPEMVRNTVGSAPSSPNLQRGESVSAPGSGMGSSMADSMEGPISLPAMSPASTTTSERRYILDSSNYQEDTYWYQQGLVLLIVNYRRARLNRSQTVGRPEIKKEKLKGLQMVVCHDCKMMVIQIIKTSRTSRNNAIRNLTLNLSPVVIISIKSDSCSSLAFTYEYMKLYLTVCPPDIIWVTHTHSHSQVTSVDNTVALFATSYPKPNKNNQLTYYTNSIGGWLGYTTDRNILRATPIPTFCNDFSTAKIFSKEEETLHLC